LTELIGAIQVTVSLSDEFDLLALLLVKLFWLADTQKGGHVWETGGVRSEVMEEVQREQRPARQKSHG
jgi:hypothetical protein